MMDADFVVVAARGLLGAGLVLLRGEITMDWGAPSDYRSTADCRFIRILAVPVCTISAR